MRKKNPVLAAILCFGFGPLGYLYISWRYAILAVVVHLIFVFFIVMVGFPTPKGIEYVVFAVFAWKGFTIVSATNQLIDSQDEHVAALNTFPVAAMAMSDLLVGVGMFYAGAIGLYLAVILILEGSVLKGLLVLVLGTPSLVWVASRVFGFIAMGIDIVFASGMENLFRMKKQGARKDSP